MTNINLNTRLATAAKFFPNSQCGDGGVNACKPSVYKTTNSLKTRTKRAFALMLFLALLAPAAAWAQTFGGGSGTETDPYIIATTDHLDNLAALVNSGNDQSGVYFLQTATLDYKGKTYTPVGTNNNFFQGNYNGNGNIITDLDINTEYAGLFGWVGVNGVVRNLKLDVTLEGIVTWCYIRGDYVGGIAAVNQGEIVGCSVLSSVRGVETSDGFSLFYQEVYLAGNRIVGGIVGDNRTTGKVRDAECIAMVECGYDSNSIAGGLVGTNNGQVNGVFGGVLCNMVSESGLVGGLVGQQDMGTLSGINRGYFNSNTNYNFIPSNSQFYAGWVGGIVGCQRAGTVENCLYVGNKWNKFAASTNAGAIISTYEYGVLNNNYYVGKCEINGMYNFTNGSVDVAGQAMRGYKIEPQNPLVINLEGSIGLAYEGNVYAGNEQDVVVNFEISNSSIAPQCYTLSAGTLMDNGDDTYTITMPEENITIKGNIVEYYGTYYEIPCDGGTTATVIYDDSYATLDYVDIEDFDYGGVLYTVTAIAEGAFDGFDNLEGVDCHSNIGTIGTNAFRNCTGITYFGFYHADTPPTLGEGVFDGLGIDTLWLSVPFCSQYDYSIHSVFGQFGEIFPDGNCEYNFTNNNGNGDKMWSNPDNWAEGEVPGETARVGIFNDCEIDADVTVGSVTIGSTYAEEYGLYERLTVKDGATFTATNFIYTTGEAENFVIEDGAQVIHPNAGAKATVQKEITAYSTETGVNNGWHLIGHSFADNGTVDDMDNLLENDYDLYYYDEPTHYWMNQENTANNFTELEAGKGYLYANGQEVVLGLKGTLRAANETVTMPLSQASADGKLLGFNLVGNPFVHNVTTFAAANVADEVYRMNGDGSNVVVSEISATNPLKPAEGFFVKATDSDAFITFNDNGGAKGGTKALEPVERPTITLNLTQNGLLIDRLIMKNDGAPLEKFTLNENSTRVYTTQDGQDYAVIVRGRDGVHTVSTEVNEMPINFKTAKNGTYTLTVNVENMDLDYLHLIDNLTGADVDLLNPKVPELVEGPTLIEGVSTGSTTSYTFTAKTTDYASRFRLVFSICGDANGDNATPFAYISNGEIVLIGDDASQASLQIVDVTGRVIRCTDVALNVSTSGMAPGVYVLRLICGDEIRTQKMVLP